MNHITFCSLSKDAFEFDDRAQPIGRGEFGEVYAANWRERGRRVALKEIKLPLRRSGSEKSKAVNAQAKDLPVRLDEFSEIRLMSKLLNEKAGHHNILEHYGHSDTKNIVTGFFEEPQNNGKKFSIYISTNEHSIRAGESPANHSSTDAGRFAARSPEDGGENAPTQPRTVSLQPTDVFSVEILKRQRPPSSRHCCPKHFAGRIALERQTRRLWPGGDGGRVEKIVTSDWSRH